MIYAECSRHRQDKSTGNRNGQYRVHGTAKLLEYILKQPERPGRHSNTGTPSGGREHAGLEEMAGMFVNTLALRSQVSGAKACAATWKK